MAYPPASITPARSIRSMSSSTRPSPISRRTSAKSPAWGIESKQRRKSASTTHVTPFFRPRSTTRSASFAPTSGRKP
jgi:hypothetical protein